MAKCDALLVGRFAEQYFMGTFWGSKRLDIIVQRGSSQLIGDYLPKKAGYRYIETSGPIQTSLNIQTQVFRKTAASETLVYLHITGCSPIEAVLTSLRTTAGGCILSWNRAYSFFALPTFIEHKSYLLHQFDGLTEDIARYDTQGGWLVQGVMWPEDTCRNHPIRERRRIGDRYTWTIPLKTEKVESSRTPDYVLEYSCFNMDPGMSYCDNARYDTKKEDVRHYKISVCKLESQVLRHTYLCGDVVMKDFLMARLHSFTIFELRKLHPEQRPTHYDQILRNRGNIDTALEGFNRPPSWTYRDDQIPTWYRAFERNRSERHQSRETAMGRLTNLMHK